MPGIQRQPLADEPGDFASELDRLVPESPFGAAAALGRRLDSIDDPLAPAELPRPFAMAPQLANDDAAGEPLHCGRWAIVGMAGFLLLMSAAGACGAILLLQDRLSRILR